MASLIKKVTSFVSNNMLLLIALLIGIMGIGYYSGSKSATMDSMTNNRAYNGEGGNAPVMDNANVNPAGPLGTNADFAQVENIKTSTPGLANCNTQDSLQDPKELLPQDTNSEWARLNPVGQGDLSDVNLLKAGHHIGINTVGQSLRNANQQLRSDPPVPQVNVGPWHNTTIEADTMRVPLELGSAPALQQ
jgi:hypothetical protein